MEAAAKRAGVSRQTIWRLRKADAEFDQAVCEAIEYQDEVRLEAVEDCLFDRLRTGKASGVEIVFSLCNRAPRRWQHVKNIRPDEPDGYSATPAHSGFKFGSMR